MSALDIVQIPVLSDNYVYLVREPETETVGVVDPALARPVLDMLDVKGWQPTHVLNTHHHHDHVGGNEELKRRGGCSVIGPRADANRIPGIDVRVGDGDVFAFGRARVRVFDVPGHTRVMSPIGSRRRERFLRRHAIRPGVRQALRGHARANVAFLGKVPRLAARNAGLLRP